MIRFEPDTWLEAVLRPVAMAAPNGWVYIEITAPDFRFLLVLLFAALLGVHLVRKRPKEGASGADRALRALGLLTALAFVVWLATSGNGRYFMPFLVLVGPLCIALAARLPATPAMRTFAVSLAVVAQGFALAQNSPWAPIDRWEWVGWKEAPYFHVDTAPVQADENITYVTVSNLSFALVAPQFPASSRWVNLSAFEGSQNANAAWHYKPVAAMLREGEGRLRLFQRAQVNAMDPVSLQPTALALEHINGSLASHGLKVPGPQACRLLRSRNLSLLTTVTSDVVGIQKDEVTGRAGFWACTLVRQQGQPLRVEPSPAQLRAGKVFARIEAACPRFFPPGQDQAQGIDGGTIVRYYGGTDTVLMLTAADELYMKYLRAMNPQLLGRGEEVLRPEFRLECNFRGRAGLPWEREI
ncbi:MAG TPA: hypothetical protein VHL79_00100 [Ramlibacter sp.]|jgi:hypothetical protein|nr:hypothetical protein [Ramlibacter sp.]